jgi:signal transduction histidine kinase
VRHAASLQEQFASDAAHELRSPLALLRTQIETNLRRERSTEEHIASQEAMLAQIERLTSLVETLLRSARQVDSPVAPVRLDKQVRVAIDQWAALRDIAPDRLRVESHACSARISEDEIHIVLNNLLDNAIRHSPPGREVIVQVGQPNGKVELSVRNFGAALSDEDAGHAFERFYRSDEGRSREDGGTGIGLAVVKRIVEARGGEVRFVRVSEGALIRMSLPSATS